MGPSPGRRGDDRHLATVLCRVEVGGGGGLSYAWWGMKRGHAKEYMVWGIQLNLAVVCAVIQNILFPSPDQERRLSAPRGKQLGIFCTLS